MSSENMNWTRWPHPHAVGDPQLGETEKRAELMNYDDHSPEGLLRGMVAEFPSWQEDMPEDVEKTSALRFGTAEPLPSVTMKNIWRHPNAHPMALTLILLNKYGNEYLEWEPEALRTTLKKDETLISDSVWTKILAARVGMMSPAPWRQWEQFHHVVNGLAGRPPNFVYLERPEIGFIMAGIDTMKMMDRPRPFAEDIAKFVAATLRERGIVYAPAPLQFVQEELDDKRLHCNNCGLEERDDHDIKCVACGSKDLKRLPGFFEDLRDEIKKRFDARKRHRLEKALDGLGQEASDEATYKLLVHNEYKNQIRAQLLQQLRMIKES
jgi:hypothetical protein